MQLLLNGKVFPYSRWPKSQILKKGRATKLRFVLLALCFFLIKQTGNAQGISLSLKNASLERLFRAVEQQSNFSFVYSQEAVALSKPVSIEVKNETIDRVLQLSFAGQPLSYALEEKFIIIKVGEEKAVAPPLYHDVKGRVVNEQGAPMAGVTIGVKGSGKYVAANHNGEFTLNGIMPDAVLEVSGAEIRSLEVSVGGQAFLLITAQQRVSSLDETIVMAYGQTTRRLNTGNISKVGAEEIGRQPVSNPLAALQGRVPGLLVTQTSGLPGSSFKVQIQGQKSIASSGPNPIVKNDPLFVIDGVPFATGNGFLSQLRTALGYPQGDPSVNTTGGLSPLNLINPADIESIEILKDADATAIYGSRGANGVVLITMKKGQAGKTRVNLGVYSGFSRVAKKTGFLTTSEYLQMRKEAIVNEGAEPNTAVFTAGYAPDLLLWDTTRYTDWNAFFTGGTAYATDVQLSVMGGNAQTQFLLGGGYNRQTTVFPGDFNDSKTSLHVNLNHAAENKRLTINFNANYVSDRNNLLSQDLTNFVNIAPNFPSLLDGLGNLKWSDNGVDFRTIGFANPLAFLLQRYRADSRNLNSNALLGYKITRHLSLKTSLGYNTTEIEENLVVPKSSQNPDNGNAASSEFGDRLAKSWIMEPQAEYVGNIAGGKLNVLLGATWQSIDNSSAHIAASGYTSDDLLGSMGAAALLTGKNDMSQYKYNALFARINYNWQDKYIINLSGRRDGSSRFGPGKQFANFGALGAAWLFTNEKMIKQLRPFISFGKLKASYGTAGNDQIGNYIYFNSWSNSGLNVYQGVPALGPVRLFNPDFAWEINKKLSGGVELGLFRDRILFSIVWYQNRSGNQLVVYNLPTQTGFPYLQAYNLPATVQNKGWEFALSSKTILSKSFNWTTSLNLSFNKNKLLSFPDLHKSPYSSTYVVGQSLSVINRLEYLGVDPSSGIYSFKDLDNDGNLDAKDYQVLGNLDPEFYGGLSNAIGYKSFSMDIFFEFRRQAGANFLADQAARVPGFFYYNQPRLVLDRWLKSGGTGLVQRFTSEYGSAYAAASNLLPQSNGVYGDASFIRLKNVSLSYSLPAKWISRLRFEKFRFYMLAQNLATLTKYKGADPETQSLNNLPPLRTVTAGVQVTF